MNRGGNSSFDEPLERFVRVDGKFCNAERPGTLHRKEQDECFDELETAQIVSNYARSLMSKNFVSCLITSHIDREFVPHW